MGEERRLLASIGLQARFEETAHGHSGLLVADNGTRIFLEEKDLQNPVGLELYLAVPDQVGCKPNSPVEIVSPITATHWGRTL